MEKLEEEIVMEDRKAEEKGEEGEAKQEERQREEGTNDGPKVQYERFDDTSKPSQRISVRLLKEVLDIDKESEEDFAETMFQAKTLHLEWSRIPRIENLELLTNLHELYLQNNRIREIENLECVPNLTFLALGSNLITEVKGIRHLKKLKFVDLSENCIERVDTDALPPTLRGISLFGNPVALTDDYRPDLILALPNLFILDNAKIPAYERRALYIAMGREVDEELQAAVAAEAEEEESWEEGDDEVEESQGRGTVSQADSDTDAAVAGVEASLADLIQKQESFLQAARAVRSLPSPASGGEGGIDEKALEEHMKLLKTMGEEDEELRKQTEQAMARAVEFTEDMKRRLEDLKEQITARAETRRQEFAKEVEEQRQLLQKEIETTMKDYQVGLGPKIRSRKG